MMFVRFSSFFFSFSVCFFHSVAFILCILFVLFTTTCNHCAENTRCKTTKRHSVLCIERRDATVRLCSKLKPKIRKKQIFELEKLIVSGGGTKTKTVRVSWSTCKIVNYETQKMENIRMNEKRNLLSETKFFGK